jgi:hypothetical protein
MEENNEIITQEMLEILEEIQVNSYNLNQQFLKLNEEILQADSITSSAIKTNYIQKTSATNDLILIVLMITFIVNFIKLRGERKL